MGAESALLGAAGGISPWGWVGAGLGAVNAIGKFFLGSKQQNLADQIHPIYEQYKTSPYAKQSLGAAMNLFNARVPGAASATQSIGQSQANTIANINRNATDSSTALALASGAQGQADQSYNTLASKEGTQKYGLLDNIQNAYNQLVGEDRYANQQMLQKYGIDTNAKYGLRESGISNQYSAGNDLSSLALLLGQYGGQNKKLG